MSQHTVAYQALVAMAAFWFAATDAKSCVIDGAENGMLPRADRHFKSDKSLDQKIDDLEACAKLYRNGQSTFENGDWKLSEFYTGVGSAARLNNIQGLYQAWQQRHPNSPSPKLFTSQEKVYDAMGSLNVALATPGLTQSFAADAAAVNAANQALDAVRETAQVDPYWYVLKARLLLMSERNDTRAREVMLDGIRRFPEYADLYSASADYFLPKWGGTSEALENWARDAARESASAPHAYAYSRIYTHAFRVQYVTDLFTQSRADWLALKTDANRMLADYPVQSNVARFTTTACLAGDHAETARLVALNPQSSYLGYWLDNEAQAACVDWAKKSWLTLKLDSFNYWLAQTIARIATLVALAEDLIYKYLLTALQSLHRPQ